MFLAIMPFGSRNASIFLDEEKVNACAIAKSDGEDFGMGILKHLAPLGVILAWEGFAFAVVFHYYDTVYNYYWWETSLAVFVFFIIAISYLSLKKGGGASSRIKAWIIWMSVFSAITYSLRLEGVALGLVFAPSTETMKKRDMRVLGHQFPDNLYSDIKWGFEDYGAAVRRWAKLRY